MHPAPASSPTPRAPIASHRAKRIALLLLAGAVFALAARALGPFRSSAASSRDTVQPPTQGASPRELGRLIGADLRVVVHTSPDGPRYSILSPDGSTLAANITVEEVTRRFPMLRLETMTADAHQPNHRSLD